MRRLRDRRPAGLFSGNELVRLLTMVVMLGVLALLFARARDPGTWRWLAPEAPNVGTGTAPAAADTTEEDVAAAERVAAGPTGDDPQERDAAREEFEAVTDKAPLAKEEMPAYWRLLAWQQHEPLAAMRQRAKKDITFKQLWQQPEKWRGQLVEIPVHLKQTAHVDELADNSLGLKDLDEVWGWTTDSQPYSYWFVCPQLPPGMPRGTNITEEATFVGYFLKLIPYEDHQGVSRATPLLIGRLIWHPAAGSSMARDDEGWWPWMIGGVLAILFAVRWGSRWRNRHSGGVTNPATRHDDHAVAEWLDRAGDDDERVDLEADNGHAQRPS